MLWRVDFSEKADKQLLSLDKSILKDLSELPNPRLRGEPLTGNLSDFWKFRIGDYRLICRINDKELIALVVKIGHRSDVYKNKEARFMLSDFYSYIAVFSHEADGWIVNFPDLERCSTNADSLDEAIVQAHNILEDYMAILERNNMPVQPSTPHEDIKTPLEGSKQRIVVSMREARIRWANETVRKTVTLPAWIVQKANFQGLNLSKILLDSLKRKLKDTVPAGA